MEFYKRLSLENHIVFYEWETDGLNHSKTAQTASWALFDIQTWILTFAVAKEYCQNHHISFIRRNKKNVLSNGTNGSKPEMTLEPDMILDMTWKLILLQNLSVFSPELSNSYCLCSTNTILTYSSPFFENEQKYPTHKFLTRFRYFLCNTSGLEYVEILHVDYIRYESDNFGSEYTLISKNDLQQTSDLRLIYCSGPRLKG